MNAAKAFAPATISNVGSGFDLLGAAISGLGDKVIARKTDRHQGVKITSITGFKDGISKEDNTASAAVKALMSSLEIVQGIDLEIEKDYAHSSGLGSSAASAVAAVVATNFLLRRPYKEKRDLLPFAYLGEKSQNPSLPSDNIAASLLGGLMLSHFADDPIRLPLPQGLGIVIVRGPIPISTSSSRLRLSPSVPLENHVHQSFALASLVAGLYRTDFELIKRGFSDILIAPQRQTMIPTYSEVVAAAQAHDALGCSISGSGPSMFAIFQNTLQSAQFADVLVGRLNDHQVISTTFDLEGARIC